MDGLEENSVLLLRGDDPQIQQLEEENLTFSEKENSEVKEGTKKGKS